MFICLYACVADMGGQQITHSKPVLSVNYNDNYWRFFL